MRLRFKPQLHFVALISVRGTFLNYEQQQKRKISSMQSVLIIEWTEWCQHISYCSRENVQTDFQRKLHTWSNSVSSLSRSCSKNLSSPWALKMRSDSSEKRTASPSNATLSCVSDTSVSFSGMNMVAAAMPGHKRSQRHKNRFSNN